MKKKFLLLSRTLCLQWDKVNCLKCIFKMYESFLCCLCLDEGLLTRDEQIILGVLLSFFLAVLLITIICVAVK